MDERDVRDDGSEEAVGVEEIEETEGREAADEAGEEVASENAGVDLTVDLTGGGSGSVDLTDKGGILVQCRHLTRTVPDATTGRPRKILNDVSVDFRPGEVTAIIGPSGCGKSTLLKAICGIDQADAPRGGVRSGVFLNGRDYYGHIEDLSKRIAYLPQFDAEWLHDDLTVQQELEYVQRLRTTTGSKADRNRVSAINEELSNKHVYDQKVSTIRSLSGGEKKRVAIVGACLADPSLLLLDEPTAPLDPGTSASFVRDLVRDSRREGLTTIMVTHDPLALQGMGDDCHVVLMGKGGYLVFDGAFADLRERLMARYSSEAADLGAALQCLFASFAANDDLGFLDNAGDGEQGEGDTEVKWRTLPSIDPPGRLRQFGILLSREISLLRGNTSQLALLMFVPLLLGLLMTFIAGDGNLYADGPYTTLVATMFSLAAGSFFIGVFDSISAFSARVRIKNEELHGMRVGPYVTAVAVTMTLLCLVQTAILVLAFNAVVGVPSLDPLYGGFPDMFMSLFLCMHSAAMLGMLCSTVVRNTTYVAPLLVIVQIMFSKVLISLDGFADKISKVISLRWTMNSLAAITNINDFNPFNWNAAEYVSEKMTLFEGWTTLSLLSLAAFAACLFVMSMKRRALFHPDFLAMRKAGLVVARIKGFLTNRYVLIALLVAAVGFMLTQNVIALSAGGVLEQIGSTGSFVGEVASDAPGLAGEWAGDGAWGRDPEEREAYKEVRDRAQEAADAERKRQEEQAMRDMDPADRARLRQEMLGEMTPEERRQIIEEMTPEERREIAEQLTPEERREIAGEVAKESQGKGTPDPSSTFGGLLGGSR